jgi:hypothetical protein
MKIRIRGNTIRLRLTKTEVDTFSKEGYLEEKTDFGPTSLAYALESLAGIDDIEATYLDNKIIVFVPEALKNVWTSTDLVGINNSMDIHNGKFLFILIEKDWACIDNILEDQSDNYPNPNKC